MEKQPTMVVIIIRPGPLRSSIQALLNAMPQVQIVAEVKEILVLLQRSPEIRPDLVLLEAGLFDGNSGQILRMITKKWAETKFMVLVENDAQQAVAQEAGADAVLFQGFKASRFVEAIETLLADPANGERSF